MKVQIGFRVDEEFHRRLQDESSRRSQSLQFMIVEALDVYMKLTPRVLLNLAEVAEDTGWSLGELIAQGAENRVLQHETLKRKKRPGKDYPGISIEEHRRMAELIEKRATFEQIIEKFPKEKIQLLLDMLTLDLRYYRSARIKPKAADEEAEG
jgi:hypothetical protein